MIYNSIIIVNFRTARFIIDCLRSIYQHSVHPEMEIIVVDNFSQDNSEQVIRTEFPGVKWIQMGYNSGFARGNNAGIRAAKGDTILLLNPDTLDETNAIEECFREFKLTDYIACGVQLTNPDGTPQISGNYYMAGGLNHLMALPYLGRLIRAVGLGLKVKKTNLPQAKGKVEVDWINGAFLMVRKQAIDKAGLLNEDFFLYSEEIEWCSRLGKTGKMYIDGALNIIHLEGSAANKEFVSEGKGYHRLDDRKGLQIMLSGLVRIRKQYGVFWFLFHFLSFLITIPIYFFVVLIKTIFFNSGARKEWNAWTGFTGNVLQVCRYFFRIVGNRPHFYKVL
jgi:GT2 family glycosyltransferase